MASEGEHAMKTALRGCGCVPRQEANGRFYHSTSCRVHSRMELTDNDLQLWRAQNRAADKAAERHPARGTQRPLRIVEDISYEEAHRDDDDDTGAFA